MMVFNTTVYFREFARVNVNTAVDMTTRLLLDWQGRAGGIAA